MIDKGICDKRVIWKPSNCECECGKSCDVGEYLNYKNCKCRRILIDKLVEECSENIDGSEMIYSGTLNNYDKVCISCTIYELLFVIPFLIQEPLAKQILVSIAFHTVDPIIGTK